MIFPMHIQHGRVRGPVHAPGDHGEREVPMPGVSSAPQEQVRSGLHPHRQVEARESIEGNRGCQAQHHFQYPSGLFPLSSI